MHVRSFTAISIFLAVAATVLADNWPNWRGPLGDGTALGTGYATSWSDTSNLIWKVDLPGVGGSTPAVWGDRIFVTCPSNQTETAENLVLCYDGSGKLLWQRDLGRERQGKHKKGSGSNPSPLTDGEHVYCYFKSGDLACLDFEGHVVWQKNLQREFAEDTLWWDLGTSPVLTENALVVACVQSGPSYVVAFDKTTGDVMWKQDRMLDAPDEANQTYSTPIVTGSGENERLIILGADHVTAHEAKTGKELWRVGGLNPTNNGYFRSISSPVLSDDLVIAPYARGGSLTAIRMGGRGNVTETHVVWSIDSPSSDVPTPAVSDGKVYVLTDKGTVAAVDPQSGKTVWTGDLPKNRHAYSASPVIADGKLYVVREDGTTFVLQTDEFKVLAENVLNDQVVATPVFVNGRILLRAAEHLYCIGQ